MHPTALKLLTDKRICVLSVPLADGSPHAAVVHYSEQTDPVKIFIQSYPTVKTKAIQEKGGVTNAAVVIGFDEEEFVSLQMRGTVRIVTDPQELESIYVLHFAKHPHAEKYKNSRTIFLEFIPTWWRHTDFKTDPETVIHS